MRTRGLLRWRTNTGKLVVISFLSLCVLVYCYYYTSAISSEKNGTSDDVFARSFYSDLKKLPPFFSDSNYPFRIDEQCTHLEESKAEIDTVDIYAKFDFQPEWVRTKEFWDASFEKRYEFLRNASERPPLRVFIVPHSHNDPGWLKTYETYFELKSKNIINNVVNKLKEHRNMTFIWSEISYLSMWWESAHPTKQKILKKLIKEGRLEITSGGWVMPDEANTHIYALVDQFIEGHLWLNTTLGVSPVSGWSIDPFGHGPTVPHLLEASGIEGTIIQRIHYAWKQWLASNQIEDFIWLPGWKSKSTSSMIVHNQPFDIYSVKSSCGPHPATCLSFDFRRIPGEYTEYSARHEPIDDQNVHRKSRILMDEYWRMGSLTSHNVILVPLGDDFRYEYELEFDQQYVNYVKLMNYINSYPKVFNAEISFGTPRDYFEAVKERQKMFPTIRGDFFVYSDIYSEGRPAYWSGYFTTRPYLKILTRQLEHNLRNAEILFTLVTNILKQNASMVQAEKRLGKYYEQIIKARRNLGLFQHHDAITGTSKAAVMYDYGTKIFTSLYHCMRIQEAALSTVMLQKYDSDNFLQSETEWETYGKLPNKLKVLLDKQSSKFGVPQRLVKNIVVFNSLTETRVDVVTLQTNTSKLSIYDNRTKEFITYQVNPNVHVDADGKHVISTTEFDILFIVELPPLSAVTFTVEQDDSVQHFTKVFCDNCIFEKGEDGRDVGFIHQKTLGGDIQLENKELKLLINRNTGFLRQIYRKSLRRKNVCEIQFAAYQSAQRHSGSYLFMPDYENPEKDILSEYVNKNSESNENILIISGPISTEITTLYLPLLSHTVRIYNTDHKALSQAIYMETITDFETPPKNRETELFVRIQTDIQNGDVPEFYTDQNGFQFQKRVKVTSLNIEANYFPITTMAFMQDNLTRLTFVTNHAQGASSFEPGRLEVMLDRRTLYDDYRGMGEGVVDNKVTLFQNWLILESFDEKSKTTSKSRNKRSFGENVSFRHVRKVQFEPNERLFNMDRRPSKIYQLPSNAANYLSRISNYPLNVYISESNEYSANITIESDFQFVRNFPEDVHLVNLRTLTDEIFDQFPSKSAFMILQRQGFSCDVGKGVSKSLGKFKTNSGFHKLKVEGLTLVSITGLNTVQILSGMHEIEVDPMDLKNYMVTF